MKLVSFSLSLSLSQLDQMTSLVDYSNLEQQRKAVTTTDSPIEGVPTAQRVRLINSIQTELLVQSFKDRILVILTQLGRIGCLVRIRTFHSLSLRYKLITFFLFLS
jgi:hypothetical protein